MHSFLTCFCLFFFFLNSLQVSAFDLPLLDLLSQTLSLTVSLLFPFCSCFCSYHSSSFCSISPLFPLLTSLFLSLFPLAAQPLTTFSLADNFPRAQPQQLCLHGHLHGPEVLGWGTLSSLAPSMVLGDGREPLESASAPKGVEGTHKVSAFLTWSDGNTDELGVCTCRRAADLLSAPCSNFPPPQSLVSVLQIRHLVLW